MSIATALGLGVLGVAVAAALRSSAQPAPGISWADLATTSTGLPNDLPAELRPNARRVAQLVALVRAETGLEVWLNSCYRSPEVNQAVGGATNSYHLQALGADVESPELTADQLADMVAQAAAELGEELAELLTYDDDHVHFALFPDDEATA